MIFHLKKLEKCSTDKNITLLVDAVKIVGYPYYSRHTTTDFTLFRTSELFQPKVVDDTAPCLVIKRNNTVDIDCIDHMSRSRSSNNDLQVF